TGGFITGPSAIDGVVTAIKRAHGSTKGIVLAKVMEHFHNVPTISGNVSFSPKLHTVFGRRYRVIRIQNNVPKVVGTIVAKVLAKIGAPNGSRGGPERRSGPPPCHGPSRAFMPCVTSRSSSSAARSSG